MATSTLEEGKSNSSETMSKRKEESCFSWGKTFPREPEGEDATVFMKRLMLLAISQILYYRGLASKRYFRARRINKMKVYYIVPDKKMGRICKDAIDGALSMVEKRYLRQFVIEVLPKSGYDSDLLEAYTFSFCYSENKPSVYLMRAGEDQVKEVNYGGPKATQVQTKNFLGGIISSIKIMEPFPCPVYPGFKLTYFSDLIEEPVRVPSFSTHPRSFPRTFGLKGQNWKPSTETFCVGTVNSERIACKLTVVSTCVENAAEIQKTINGRDPVRKSNESFSSIADISAGFHRFSQESSEQAHVTAA